MTLLNFNLFDTVLFYEQDLHLKFKLINTRDYTTKISNLLRLKHNQSSFLVSLKNDSISNQFSLKLPITNKKRQIIRRNFWQKLINKYWQETIFISSSNSALDYYANKLKSTGLSVYESNDYKNFLLQFSRDLLDRKINVNTQKLKTDNVADLANSSNLSIQYRWLKFYNFFTLFLKNHHINVNINNFINQYNESLPLFTLVNDYNQIILAESSDQLSNHRIFLKFYNKLTNKGLYNKNLYTGLFFVNPEDAIEYKQYINYKYGSSTRNIKVKPVVTTLNFYYKVLSQSNRNIELRLIPDLKEVSYIINTYKKYKNLEFDSNQQYGNNYFQGQPIYLIKPVEARTINGLNTVKYFYSSSNSKGQNNITQYNAVFLSYETAIQAWESYKKTVNNYILPIKPSLYVSNLETFVRTFSETKNKNEFILLPSLETFNFIQKYFNNNLQTSNHLRKFLKNKSLYFKGICYRAIWSLTTRQPSIW